MSLNVLKWAIQCTILLKILRVCDYHKNDQVSHKNTFIMNLVRQKNHAYKTNLARQKNVFTI